MAIWLNALSNPTCTGLRMATATAPALAPSKCHQGSRALARHPVFVDRHSRQSTCQPCKAAGAIRPVSSCRRHSGTSTFPEQGLHEAGGPWAQRGQGRAARPPFYSASVFSVTAAARRRPERTCGRLGALAGPPTQWINGRARLGGWEERKRQPFAALIGARGRVAPTRQALTYPGGGGQGGAATSLQTPQRASKVQCCFMNRGVIRRHHSFWEQFVATQGRACSHASSIRARPPSGSNRTMKAAHQPNGKAFQS